MLNTCRCDAAGIAGHVEITEGINNLPMVVLRHSCGSQAEVRYLLGNYEVPYDID